MKVSAISQDSERKRNFFIEYSNRFMSMPQNKSAYTKALEANEAIKSKKMGIENLEEFTIFPKEVVDGKMVITA